MSILAPANGASSVRMPSIQWQPYAGADVLQGLVRPAGWPLQRRPRSPAERSRVRRVHVGRSAVDVGDVQVLRRGVQRAGRTRSPPRPSGRSSSQAPATLGHARLPDAGPLLDPGDLRHGRGYAHAELAIRPRRGSVRGHHRQRRQLHEPGRAPTRRSSRRSRPRSSFLDSQANKAFYWFVRPCVTYALTDCGPDEGTSANTQRERVPKALGAGRSRLACRRRHRRGPRHLHLDRLPRDEPGPGAGRRPGGEVVQDPGVDRRRLLQHPRHGDGRSDDLYAVQQDLPRRASVLAGPGHRPDG